MREDAALMQRIAELSKNLGESQRRLSTRGFHRAAPVAG